MLHLWGILKVNHTNEAKTRLNQGFGESAFRATDYADFGKNEAAERADGEDCNRGKDYSTVTLLARLRGWSTSQPLLTAMW